MKKIVFVTIVALMVAANMKALEPVRIGLNYPNPSNSLTVKLVDVATGQEVETVQINDVVANSSGAVSFVVGENDPDWGDLNASLASNPSLMLRVFDDQGNFVKQFVYRDLVSIQSATGNGGVLDDGFNSTGGVTTSGETNDDFLFGATAIPFGGFQLGFINENEETKFFFKNNLGAIRAGAVTGTQWNLVNLGSYSAAFGNSTEAYGDYSFAAGYITSSSGDYSVALGNETSANGEGSLAIGLDNTADGNYSAALGLGTTAKSYGEFVVGIYNTDYTATSTNSVSFSDRLFVIGNGDDSEGIFRSDAMVVYKNGNTELNGNASIFGELSANGILYPSSNGNEGQILSFDSVGTELIWTDAPTFELFVDESLTGDGSEETPLSVNFFNDGTLTGDPFSEEVPLGVDLTASNTWTDSTSFSNDLALTSASFTGNDNQALYTDDNGLVTAGNGETFQNAAGIYAGTLAWDTGDTLKINETAVNSSSIITITYVGNDTVHLFRVDNIINNTSFDVITDSQTDPTGTIHYIIINQ